MADKKGKKNQLDPKQLLKFLPPANDKNHFWSVVLFALGVLTFFMTFVKGSEGWLKVHNFLLGMFGFAVIFVPIILIYTSIQIGMEKSQKCIADRAVWGIILAFLISGAVQIFVSGELIGENFEEHIKNLYKDGIKLNGGGVASYLIAGPLLGFFGSVGAKIITIMLFFVVGMFFTHKSLLEFLDFITKPFRNFGKVVQGLYSMLMGGNFNEVFDEDDLNDDIEKRSFDKDLEAINIVNSRTAPPSNPDFVEISVPINSEPEPEEEFLFDVPLESDSLIDVQQEENNESAEEVLEKEDSETDSENLDELIKRATDKAEKKKPSAEILEKETPKETLYKLPPLELLELPNNKLNSAEAVTEMRSKADIIVNTLRSFKVEVKIRDILRGPSITRYEVQPGVGVQVKKIKNLEDDIALNLAAQGVRIEAPVPGKSVVGIEVPNENKDTVTIREMLSSPSFRSNTSKLTFTVGKDIAGNIILGDIAKMPHVIIAGTTGSGKSVCTRSIIMSILYNATPDEVRMILIDPKIVEFKVFDGIPHLLIPIVTDCKKAAGALNWAVNEMMRRYQIFADVGANDLKSYNSYAEQIEDIQTMPQIVVFIDELADMMLVAGKEVEDYICRLAQMGRAAGIHLVIATQRPTTDVITGLIKANIPSRIALSVMSQVDSRTIIDMAGADKLLGNGDMLYMPIGTSKPVRVQGCFASSKDINATLDYIKSQIQGEYDSDIMQAVDSFVPQTKGSSSSNDDYGNSVAVTDEDFIEKAIELAVNNGQISTSTIQRKLKLGYARAGRIMDELEEMGIVGAKDGAKPRKVLMSKMQYDERKIRKQEGN
ncbi:MAG: DNA translocase FtsK [Ruminococcus flavefaciens]|nr:DNA translocase FtsK [Ruminococcus flavefaciens]